MTSHGHGIARATGPRTEEQRRIDIEKIGRYRSLDDQVREKAAQKDYGQETWQLTSKLLRLNPEYYTVWNARRRCIISCLQPGSWASSSFSKASSSSSPTGTPSHSSATSLPTSSSGTQRSPELPSRGKNGTNGTVAEEAETSASESTDHSWKVDLETLKSELIFTVPLLMNFPKCYWIWNYRLWVLGQTIERLPPAAARKVWEDELGLVGKMLHKDRRNFHAWGYRRYLVDRLESAQLSGKSLVEPEFEYTTKMIHTDLSNFSAWHYRSQLIPRLLSERQADDDTRQKFLQNELALVREGLNVGPEDQSLWFYHQYLVYNVAGSPGSHAIAPRLSAEERKTYIEEEIAEVKDLLEDYPDIKWIYEALIHYTQALSRLDGAEVATTHKKSICTWLQKIRKLDPQRNGRWEDLESDVIST